MNRHLVYFIALGLFWGLSPTLYRAMGEAAVPVSHIMVYSGVGVGLALAAVAWATTGRLDCSRPVILYGLGCALLMNFPFGASLYIARHVPTVELALIVSTAPLFNYGAALLTGRENAAPRRLLAVGIGFLSSAVLILSRDGALSGHISWWTIAAFSVPVGYMAYNWFAARHWPRGADTMSVGASESIWSAITVAPVMLVWRRRGRWQYRAYSLIGACWPRSSCGSSSASPFSR